MSDGTYLVECFEQAMTAGCYVNAFGKHASVLIAFPLSVLS